MIPSILIRKATPDDAEQVRLLRKRISASPKNRNPPLDPYGDIYPTVKQQQTEIENYVENGIFLAAIDEQQVVGLAFCFEIYARPGEYRLNFEVDSEWRRQGIGSTLVAQVVEWAKSNPKVQRLICSFHSSHKDAEYVCRKLGFRVSRKGFDYFMQAFMYHRMEMMLTL